MRHNAKRDQAGAQSPFAGSTVLHILQPLDHSGLLARLRGVGFDLFLFGFAGFTALLLLTFGHHIFQSQRNAECMLLAVKVKFD